MGLWGNGSPLRQIARVRTALVLGMLLHAGRACRNDEDELRSCYNSGTLDSVDFHRVCKGFGDCSSTALDSCQAKCDWAKLTAFCYKVQGCLDNRIGSQIGRTTGREHCEQFKIVAGFMEGCVCDADCSAAFRGRGRPLAPLLFLLTLVLSLTLGAEGASFAGAGSRQQPRPEEALGPQLRRLACELT
mmetsp:Transcript_89759/g.238466  ORF Transcript_89759/g.238466 Transcript_89759/m.238466 type:complete len:188 (-) Transcript_89759:57-620(-)